MARVHGKDFTAINVDNAAGTPADFKAQTVSVDFGVSKDTHETTVVGEDWKTFASGLKGGDEFVHHMFYTNDTTTGTYAVMTGRFESESAGTFSFTDGTRTTSMETIVTKVSAPINVGDMTKLAVSHKLTGPVTFS